MTIYLLRTPDYSQLALNNLLDFLQSFDGPISFVGVNDPFEVSSDDAQDNYYDDIRIDGELEAVSWDELFSKCHHFRAANNLPPEDKVVILTGHPNPHNWFSSWDPRGYVFVHTADWLLYVNAPEQYPLAYQVLETVLQMLMKLDPLGGDSPWVHADPLGCVNDFCENKRQIILKLRTGDICSSCLQKLREENVSNAIVNHVLTIFEGIRSQVLFKQGFSRNIQPERVTVNDKGQVKIGEKIINLDYLPKSLFIFFLKHPEGVALNDLENHKEELWEIYRSLRPAAQSSSIVELVRPYNDPRGSGTFSVNKNRLNKGLRVALGEPLANFYYLEGSPGEPFKIHMDPNAISLDIRY